MCLKTAGSSLDKTSRLQLVTLEVSSRKGTSQCHTKHMKTSSFLKFKVFDHSHEMEDYVDDLVDDEDNLTLSFKMKGEDISICSVVKIVKYHNLFGCCSFLKNIWWERKRSHTKIR